MDFTEGNVSFTTPLTSFADVNISKLDFNKYLDQNNVNIQFSHNYHSGHQTSSPAPNDNDESVIESPNASRILPGICYF
jgi:hypothetical protein